MLALKYKNVLLEQSFLLIPFKDSVNMFLLLRSLYLHTKIQDSHWIRNCLKFNLFCIITKPCNIVGFVILLYNHKTLAMDRITFVGSKMLLPYSGQGQTQGG